MADDKPLWRRLLGGAAWVYLAAGLFALALVPMSANGWFGIEPDPLSGVFALFLALPWSLLLSVFDSESPMVAGAVCLVGVLLNFAILRRLAR